MRKRILAIFIAITMVMAPTTAPMSSVYGAEQSPNCPQNHIVGNDMPPPEAPVQDFTVGIVQPGDYVEPWNNYWELFENDGTLIGPVTQFYFVTGDSFYAPGGQTVQITSPTGRQIDATVMYLERVNWSQTNATLPAWSIANVSVLPANIFIGTGDGAAVNAVRNNTTFFFDEGRFLDTHHLDTNSFSGNNTSIVGLHNEANGDPSTVFFKPPVPGGQRNAQNAATNLNERRMMRYRFNTPNNYIRNVIFDGSGIDMRTPNGHGSGGYRGSYFWVVGTGSEGFVARDVILQNIGQRNTTVNDGGIFSGVNGNQRNVAINILSAVGGQRNFEDLTIRNVRTTAGYGIIQFNRTNFNFFQNVNLIGAGATMNATANPIKIEHSPDVNAFNNILGGDARNQHTIVFDGDLLFPINRDTISNDIWIQDYRYRNILVPSNFAWALCSTLNGGNNNAAIRVYNHKRSPSVIAAAPLQGIPLQHFAALQLDTGYWFVEANLTAANNNLQAQLNRIHTVRNIIETGTALNPPFHGPGPWTTPPAPNIKMIANNAGNLGGFTIPSFTTRDFTVEPPVDSPMPANIIALMQTDTPNISVFPAHNSDGYAHASAGVQGDGVGEFVPYSGSVGGIIMQANTDASRIFNFDFKNPENLGVGVAQWTIDQATTRPDGSQGYIHNFVRENSGRNLFFRTLPTITKEAGYLNEHDAFVTFDYGDYVLVGDTIVYRLRVTNHGGSPIPARMVVGDDINLYHVNWEGNVTINGTPATPGTAPNQYTFVFGGAPPLQQQFGIVPASLPGLLGQLRVTLPEIPAGGHIYITFEVTARAPAAENPLHELDVDGDYVIIDEEKVFLFYGVRNVAFIVNEGEDNTYSNIVDVEVKDPTTPTYPNIRKFSSVMLPTLATVGETIQYTLVVRNPGSEPLTDVVVRDPLYSYVNEYGWVRFVRVVDPIGTYTFDDDPSSPTYGVLTYNIGTLEPRTSYTIRFEVEVLNAAALPRITFPFTADPEEVRVIPNTAYLYVKGEQVDYDNQPVSIHPALPPQIHKSVNPTTAEPGDTVTYTLRIYNPNHAPNAGIYLLNVEILDEFPEWIVPDVATVVVTAPNGDILTSDVEIDFDLTNRELTIEFDELPPGPGYTYIEFLATVAANAPTGSHDNNAFIYWNDVRIDSNTATVVVTGIQQPPQTTVTIEKTASEPSVVVGETITYTITVANTGTNPAANVVVTDTLPTQVTFVDSTSNVQGINFTHANGVLTSNVGTLAAGASIEFTVNVTANVVGNAVNNVGVTGGNFPTANDNEPVFIIDETQPQPEPGVSIAKTVVTGPTVAPGGTVVYTLVVTNTGDVALTDLMVTDALPPDLTPGATLILPQGATGSFSGDILTVTLAELAPNTSVTIVFTAEVVAGTPDDTAITNFADVEDGVTGVSDDDSATVTVADPSDINEFNVNIVKVATSGNTAKVGDTVTYLLMITNTGNEYLNNLVVTDELPNGLINPGNITVLPGAINYSFVSSILSATLAPLAPGASVIITFTAEVETGLANNTTITNTAHVSGEINVDGETLIVSDHDRETITITAPELAPNVTIEKSVSPGSVTAGSNVNYTLRITNSGGVNLTSLVVTDILPGELTNPRNLVVPAGATNYGFTGQSLSVTLADLAPGASVTITFTAAVTSGTAVGTTITNTATVTDEDAEVTASDSATVEVIRGGGGGGGGGGGTPQPPVEVPDPEPPLVEMSPYHHAYIIGYPDGYVRPARNITRAEVATIFFRLISDEHRVNIWSQSNPFADVILQNWFNNAISTLTNANLLYGYPDGYFRPNQAMTRAEFSAVIVRIMGERGAMETATSSFTDVSGHWGEAYINVAYQLGWVRGYGDGTFRPNQLITRAEVAALVNRALNRLPETPADLLADMVIWPDNMNTGAWYYLYMQEATNSHYHEMKADGIHETWTEFIEPREWWRLERPNSNPGIFTGAYIGEGMGMDY